jgi:hypothetical protein
LRLLRSRFARGKTNVKVEVEIVGDTRFHLATRRYLGGHRS